MCAFSPRLAVRPAHRLKVLLLALWLVGAQCLLAAHQVDHILHFDDDCPVCLIGHDLGHGATTNIAMPAVPVSLAIVVGAIIGGSLEPVVLSPYLARAPPY
jgi:hypothetical protein